MIALHLKEKFNKLMKLSEVDYLKRVDAYRIV